MREGQVHCPTWSLGAVRLRGTPDELPGPSRTGMAEDWLAPDFPAAMVKRQLELGGCAMSGICAIDPLMGLEATRRVDPRRA